MVAPFHIVQGYVGPEICIEAGIVTVSVLSPSLPTNGPSHTWNGQPVDIRRLPLQPFTPSAHGVTRLKLETVYSIGARL